MPALPSVSVVIPVYNGGAVFRQCLKSVRRSEHVPEEIIVVADGDTDGSRHVASHWGATVLVNDTPQGPARARNRGAQAARGDVLFFVDADVTVYPDTMGRVAAAFAGDVDLDALVGSYDSAPADPHFLSQYRNLLHHYTHQTADPDASTFWGACGAIRWDVFLEAGGFDESYDRPCIEDIELGYRLRQAGHTIRLFKDIQVKHHKRWSAATMIKTDVFSRGLPWTELLLRHRRLGDDDLNIKQGSRLSVALAGVLLAGVAGLVAAPLAAAAGIVGAAGGLLWLNRSFYRFLWRERGTAFVLGVLPWHWLYFSYSGLSFVLGAARYLTSSARSASSSLESHPANRRESSPTR